MKRKGFTSKELLGVGLVVAGAVAVVWPMIARPNRGCDRPPSCLNNLKQLGFALAHYSHDYDKHYPRVAGIQTPTVTDPYGWADALYPYLKNAALYHCPTEPSKDYGSALAPTQRNCTDYWFNANLSGLDVSKSRGYGRIIAFGDGNDGTDLTDARYNLWALPAPWLADKSSPLYRHLEGANYAFMDGHVKFLRPDTVGGPMATFSPK